MTLYWMRPLFDQLRGGLLTFGRIGWAANENSDGFSTRSLPVANALTSSSTARINLVMSEFTHLHLHTEYSLLDGACDVYKLVDRVAALGQKSVAMTDHGNIYGAVHFFEAAKAKGIKPILGCELYVCKAEDHRADTPNDQYNHLLVLAENEEGYRNLIRLTSEASLNGFYRKPRVSKKYLAENCK